MGSTDRPALLLDNLALGIALGPELGLPIGVGADQTRKRFIEDPESPSDDG
ncbi:hypothetical protein [Brachybacterium sp.]|uniref:hypothetical protein n=1 Tax=Brachybacterium sp. TaxID=1891286 RepID=UPI002ED09599